MFRTIWLFGLGQAACRCNPEIHIPRLEQKLSRHRTRPRKSCSTAKQVRPRIMVLLPKTTAWRLYELRTLPGVLPTWNALTERSKASLCQFAVRGFQAWDNQYLRKSNRDGGSTVTPITVFICFSKLNWVMQFQRSSRLLVCVVPRKCAKPSRHAGLKFATPLVIT